MSDPSLPSCGGDDADVKEMVKQLPGSDGRKREGENVEPKGRRRERGASSVDSRHEEKISMLSANVSPIPGAIDIHKTDPYMDKRQDRTFLFSPATSSSEGIDIRKGSSELKPSTKSPSTSSDKRRKPRT